MTKPVMTYKIDHTDGTMTLEVLKRFRRTFSGKSHTGWVVRVTCEDGVQYTCYEPDLRFAQWIERTRAKLVI